MATRKRATITPYKRPPVRETIRPSSPTYAPPPRPAFNPYALPLDPGYDQASAAANRQYDVTTSGLGYQEGRVKQDYGFEDTSNPYNRAKLLERSYQQGQLGSTNSMAAQGQLYSGALQNKLGEGTYQYSRGLDEARRSYADALHQIAQQRLQAGVTKDASLAGAYQDRLNRAISIYGSS